MRVLLAVIVSALSVVSSFAAETASSARVQVSPCVELVSLVFRLAGAEEYNQPQSRSAYSEDAERWFAPLRDHGAIQFARELRVRREIGFDAVMSFAVHLTPELKPKFPFDQAKGSLDERWTPEDSEKFLALLVSFSREGKFDEFLARHEGLFAKSVAVLSRPLNAQSCREWLDSYLGPRSAEFSATIAMLNGPCNYGLSVHYPDGRGEIQTIVGAGRWGNDGVPVFDDDLPGLIVHELCHSYTNPLVQRHAKELMPAAQKILPRRLELMQQQAYHSEMPMLYESLVRAVTTRYAQLHDTPEAAKRCLEAERVRGFLWMDGLVAQLLRYEQQRDRYPTFSEFMPEIVSFMQQTADGMDALLGRLPRAVRITPAPGAKNVPAGQGELRLEFDRPMRTTSRSIRTSRDGDFPKKRSDPHYEQGGRVFVYPVTFEAGKTYRFILNGIRSIGFVSADGGWPMDPIPVEFTISP